MNGPFAGIHRPSMQRVSARGELVARLRDGQTRVERLFQEGAAKIRLPARDSEALEAILINTAGGLTGGDRIGWHIEARAGASLAVTTQACEKVYRSSGGHAETACSIAVGAGARVAWLPQETIVFDRSAFMRRLDVDVAVDAAVLLVEAAVFGRHAMGESVATATFRDRWRVRAGGRLVHAEDFAIGPDVSASLSNRAAFGGGQAFATLLLIAPDAAERMDAVRAIVGESGGASFWKVGETGKLLARLVATDGYALRERLTPLVTMLNGRAGLPKTWSL